MTRQHIQLSNKQVAPSCLQRQGLNLNLRVSHCQVSSDRRGVGPGETGGGRGRGEERSGGGAEDSAQ